MTTHRTILIAAAVLAMFVAPAFAQTQPPNSPLPGNSGTLVCHVDDNDGTIHLERLRPDFATTDTGVATEGHDTLAEGGQCLQPLQSTQTATPVATVSVAGEQATPTPTAAVEATETPTAEPTPEPTWTPEPTATKEPFNPEPTMPAGPLPDCSPDQPQGTPCGGKG